MDETGNIISEEQDLNIGVFKSSQRDIYYKWVIEQEEIGDWEVVREYPNGGKDVAWIVSTPEIGEWKTYDLLTNEDITEYIRWEGHGDKNEIYEDIENIMVYHKFTQEELEEIEKNKILRQERIQEKEILNQSPKRLDDTEEAICELGDLADMNSIATEDLSDAAVELGDLVDESVNTNIDLIDAVTELGDLVAEQADIIAQLQEIIEQLTSGE